MELSNAVGGNADAGLIPAGTGKGHAHYWCSQACLDSDCEFGPCCELPPVRVVHVMSSAHCPRCGAPCPMCIQTDDRVKEGTVSTSDD